MKFQRGKADVIAAVFTPPAADFDQALLTLNPPPFLTAVGHSAPPFSPIGIGHPALFRPVASRCCEFRTASTSDRTSADKRFAAFRRSLCFAENSPPQS